MSKLQHVINYMDMYRILKETFLAWKGGGGGGGRQGLKNICYTDLNTNS